MFFINNDAKIKIIYIEKTFFKFFYYLKTYYLCIQI